MTVNPYHISSKPRYNLHALRLAWLLLVLTSLPAAAQTCPDTGSTGTERPAVSHNTVDYSSIPIQFSFDGGSSVLNGKSDLSGAQVTQGERSIAADALHYDFTTGKIKADGHVAYEDPQLHVSGTDANMDAKSGVEFDQASFALKARAGRGSADHIQLTPQGNLHLDGVSYTTCPANKPDWELKLSDLDINQSTRTGTGRNVRLEFKDIPVFYTPWISFPVGDERKSGFLFPNFRSSSRGGYSLLIPWYWNIAPNYDMTFTPVIDSARGAELDSEFRYLSEWNNGMITANYVPHDPVQSADNTPSGNNTSGGNNDGDNILHNWRGLLQVKHQTDFNPNLRLQLNGATVSDNHWFEDFGQTRDETSQVYLPQILDFSAYSTNWVGSVAVQNLQVLDDEIVKNTPDVRPYITAPQITVAGHQRQLPFG
ncbi:MAG: LPS assembly protein LptD, partial [Steroidobacter sp.]